MLWCSPMSRRVSSRDMCAPLCNSVICKDKCLLLHGESSLVVLLCLTFHYKQSAFLDKSRRPRTMRLLQEVFVRLSEDKRVRSMYAQHAFAFNSAKARKRDATTESHSCMPKERWVCSFWSVFLRKTLIFRHSSCRIHATYMYDLLDQFIGNLIAAPALQPMYVDDLAEIGLYNFVLGKNELFLLQSPFTNHCSAAALMATFSNALESFSSICSSWTSLCRLAPSSMHSINALLHRLAPRVAAPGCGFSPTWSMR